LPKLEVRADLSEVGDLSPFPFVPFRVAESCEEGISMKKSLICRVECLTVLASPVMVAVAD
jgi:hypothetical protein